MTLKVIDTLTCIHFINLNECWCLQIKHLCYWYTYLLLLKSFFRFPGTSLRDYDVFFFFTFLFEWPHLWPVFLLWWGEIDLLQLPKVIGNKMLWGRWYSIWVVKFLVILSFLSFLSPCEYIFCFSIYHTRLQLSIIFSPLD